MILTQKQENNQLVSFSYTDQTIGNRHAAVCALVRAAGQLSARYIALRDLEHSGDEGNDSRQLRGDATSQDILEALTEKTCDRLFLAGTWKDVSVGVGISLTDWQIQITLPADRADLAEQVAGLLART